MAISIAGGSRFRCAEFFLYSPSFVRMMPPMRSFVLVLALLPLPAVAYPWTVKSGIQSCSVCHVDPSGAGQLTRFGRTEAERLVRWTPSPIPPEVAERNARFLWFAQLPSWLELSGNLRFGALVAPGAPKLVTPLEMASDLSATIEVESVLVHATAGFGRKDTVAPAIVVPRCEPADPGDCGASFVARQYWIGARAAKGAVLIRAGRLALPFGLRNNEHPSWVRSLTLTDGNVHQKLGASVSVLSGRVRFEAMGIAAATLPSANEAGYSALAELSLAPTTAVGLSSLVAARPDPTAPSSRQAHGAFFRSALLPSLVLLAEADLLAWSTASTNRVGYAAFVQGDWEPVQGLHLMLTGESAHQGDGKQRGPSLGAWVSAAWYFFSHFELRVDAMARRIDALAPLGLSVVAQLHLYL